MAVHASFYKQISFHSIITFKFQYCFSYIFFILDRLNTNIYSSHSALIKMEETKDEAKLTKQQIKNRKKREAAKKKKQEQKQHEKVRGCILQVMKLLNYFLILVVKRCEYFYFFFFISHLCSALIDYWHNSFLSRKNEKN